MNVKSKKLLAVSGLAALLIVISVSLFVFRKNNQPAESGPSAAPIDVAVEDVSKPLEEKTTPPAVEVPDVSLPESSPPQEQPDPVLNVEQEDQVDVDLSDSEIKPMFLESRTVFAQPHTVTVSPPWKLPRNKLLMGVCCMVISSLKIKKSDSLFLLVTRTASCAAFRTNRCQNPRCHLNYRIYSVAFDVPF